MHAQARKSERGASPAIISFHRLSFSTLVRVIIGATIPCHTVGWGPKCRRAKFWCPSVCTGTCLYVWAMGQWQPWETGLMEKIYPELFNFLLHFRKICRNDVLSLLRRKIKTLEPLVTLE